MMIMRDRYQKKGSNSSDGSTLLAMHEGDSGLSELIVIMITITKNPSSSNNTNYYYINGNGYK